MIVKEKEERSGLLAEFSFFFWPAAEPLLMKDRTEEVTTTTTKMGKDECDRLAAAAACGPMETGSFFCVCVLLLSGNCLAAR